MLVEISFTMAVSSSCCERGFSCMTRLKTEYRNSLDVSIVDHLMDNDLSEWSQPRIFC